MHTKYQAVVVLFSLALLSSLTLAQQPPATPPDSQHNLTFDVVVTDKSGAPIPNLQSKDLTVTDNKRPQTILAFAPHVAPPPSAEPDPTAELLLVFDEVNTTFERGAYERENVKKFLLQNHGQLTHPVSLAFFTDSGMQIQTQPAIDGNALAAAVDQHEHTFRTVGVGTGVGGDEARLRLSLDAINTLASQEKDQPGKKMVIWISPGWPMMGGMRDNLSAAQQQRVFNSVVKLSTSLRQARITLYSIDPLGAEGSGGQRTSYYQNFVKGLKDPGHADIADLALQVLATQTGGRVIFGNDTILSSINRCVADLNAFYTISIEAAHAEHPNEYHQLDIKPDTPGLTARSITGYYAQP